MELVYQFSFFFLGFSIRLISIIIFLISVNSFGNEKQLRLDRAKQLYYNRGQVKLAISLLRKNLATKPLHEPSLIFLAEAYIDKRAFSKAIRSYKILIKNRYNREIFQYKDLYKLEGYIEKQIERKQIPDEITLKLFQKLGSIFEQFMAYRRLSEKSKTGKSILSAAKRYKFIAKKFRGIDTPITDDRTDLERKAALQQKNGEVIPALSSYKELISKYYDKRVLYIQDVAYLKKYLANSVNQEQKVPLRTLNYFKQSAKLYHNLAKKNRNKLTKGRLKRILWLRNKYLFIYKSHINPEKYLADVMAQQKTIEDEMLDDLPEESEDLQDEEGDLPDEEEENLPDEEESEEDQGLPINNHWDIHYSFLYWQEKLTLSETGGQSDSLNVIVRGGCLGAQYHWQFWRMEYIIGGCLFSGFANIGSAQDANNVYYQEDVPMSGLFGHTGFLYRPAESIFIGPEIAFFTRAADWAVPSDSFTIDGTTLTGVVVFLTARYDFEKMAITQKIGKSSQTESMWTFALSYKF